MKIKRIIIPYEEFMKGRYEKQFLLFEVETYNSIPESCGGLFQKYLQIIDINNATIFLFKFIYLNKADSFKKETSLYVVDKKQNTETIFQFFYVKNTKENKTPKWMWSIVLQFTKPNCLAHEIYLNDGYLKFICERYMEYLKQEYYEIFKKLTKNCNG